MAKSNIKQSNLAPEEVSNRIAYEKTTNCRGIAGQLFIPLLLIVRQKNTRYLDQE